MGATWPSTFPTRRLVELAGDEHVPYLGDVEALIGEVEEFVTGERAPHVDERALATLLFVDIVDSTATAAAVGDGSGGGCSTAGRRWQTASFGATADAESTAPATACSRPSTVRRAPSAAHWRFAMRASRSTSSVRAGLHAGEVEIRDADIGGIAVHLAARICAHAAPDEVLVSSTVADLVAGSDLAFTSRGRHALKGIPREWELLVPRHEPIATNGSLAARRPEQLARTDD